MIDVTWRQKDRKTENRKQKENEKTMYRTLGKAIIYTFRRHFETLKVLGTELRQVMFN